MKSEIAIIHQRYVEEQHKKSLESILPKAETVEMIKHIRESISVYEGRMELLDWVLEQGDFKPERSEDATEGSMK